MSNVNYSKLAFVLIRKTSTMVLFHVSAFLRRENQGKRDITRVMIVMYDRQQIKPKY